MELRYNMTDSSYLEHYGVLGMKWGVRNDKRTPRELGYAPSQKQADRVNRKYSEAKQNLKDAKKQYKVLGGVKNAKTVARYQKKMDKASKRRDYVLSGKAAQDMARAKRIVGAASIGLSIATGLSGVTAARSAITGMRLAKELGSIGMYAHAANATYSAVTNSGIAVVQGILGTKNIVDAGKEKRAKKQ